MLQNMYLVLLEKNLAKILKFVFSLTKYFSHDLLGGITNWKNLEGTNSEFVSIVPIAYFTPNIPFAYVNLCQDMLSVEN